MYKLIFRDREVVEYCTQTKIKQLIELNELIGYIKLK